MNSGCKKLTVADDAPNHLRLDQLEPYTEYKVVVAAHLGTLNTIKEEEVVGRTAPLQPVSWSVGLDGLLTVVWRERVTDFKGENPVQVRWQFKKLEKEGFEIFISLRILKVHEYLSGSTISGVSLNLVTVAKYTILV